MKGLKKKVEMNWNRKRNKERATFENVYGIKSE